MVHIAQRPLDGKLERVGGGARSFSPSPAPPLLPPATPPPFPPPNPNAEDSGFGLGLGLGLRFHLFTCKLKLTPKKFRYTSVVCGREGEGEERSRGTLLSIQYK
eukprot:scaffold288262_cov24-Tisochrysis_lutea.AAC.1